MSQSPRPCLWCPCSTSCLCLRLGARVAELLALREWAIDCGDRDTVTLIDAELYNLGMPLPANENNSRSSET